MDIKEFLIRQGVFFELLPHPPTYDAQHLAHALHVSGRQVAKTVLLRDGDRYLVAVLPATHVIDFERLRQVAGLRRPELAPESALEEVCPDCELGALPALGSLYGARTIVDASLADGERIVFEANTHDEAVRLGYRDFAALERPVVAAFARRA